ncbi:MAG: hypothetical protein V7L20_27760 [Nostoc sp.]|uniref:hypothetical protein n=1 Tax=Nostoc sp. TaxID=1180 RepID=UPI002FF87BCB
MAKETTGSICSRRDKSRLYVRILGLSEYLLQDIIAAYELLAHTGNLAIANQMIELSSFRRAQYLQQLV